MPCLVQQYEDFKAYLKNKRAIYFFDANSTVKDTVDALDHTQQHFKLAKVGVNEKDKGDDKRRYTLHDTTGLPVVDTYLNNRVSDKVNTLFKRNKTEAEVDAYRNNENNIAKREFGSKGHKLAELIGKAYYESKINKTTYDNSTVLREANSGEYKFRSQDVASLEEGIKDVIDQIFATQKRINPLSIPTIRFENIIIDPVKDIGGTLDVIALFSNNTAVVYDYKFVNPSEVRGFGDARELYNNTFINGKKEGWKIQQSQYKQILLERYGVKDVLATKIVPIWIDFKGAPSEGKINKVRIGEKQSEYLKQIHATYAKTGVEEVDALLKSRYKELERLRTQTKDDTVRAKMRVIEDSIFDLVEEYNFETMLNDAVVLAKEAIINEDMSYEELNNVIDYLRAISTFQQLFEEKADVFKEVNQELYDSIVKVLKKQYKEDVTGYDKLRNIRGVLGVLYARRVEKLVNEEGIEIRDEEGNISLTDDDYLTKTFLTTSESENEIYRIFQNSVNKSYQNIRTELEKTVKQLNDADLEVSKWLRSRGESYNNLYRYLMNSRGDLYGQLRKEFYDERAKAKAAKDANWFVRNYRVKEKNIHGETYTENYERRRKEYAEMLTSRHAGIKEVSEFAYKKRVTEGLEEWISENNLDLNLDGTPVHPKAWLKSYWIEVKPEVAVNNYSDEYKYILNNPALKKYYDTIYQLNQEFREILGYEIPSNFLPKVRADVIEKLRDKSLSSIGQDIKELFTVRQDDTEFGHQDINTGEFTKRIPIFYTQAFRDKDNAIDITEQSKDISRSYLLFAKMAYNYKHMSEIEAKTIAMKDMLSMAKYDAVNEKGGKVFDMLHNFAKADKQAVNANVEIFDAITDHHLYGIRVQPFQGKRKLTNTTMKLKNYMSMKTLGFGVIGASAGYVAARLQAFTEGKKGVLYNAKMWDNAMIYQAKEYNKYHAFAYFFGIHNEDILQQVASGPNKIQDWLGDRTTKDAVRSYISQRTLMRPFSYLDERLDNHIAVSMAQNYGVDASGNINRLQNLPEGTKSLWELFKYDKNGNIGLGEFSDEGLKKILIQFRSAVRSGQKGIKGTINEEDINYAQTHLILNLVSQFKTWMPGIINERFGKLKYNENIHAPQWGRYRALWDEVEYKQSAGTALYILHSTKNLLAYIAKDLLTFGNVQRGFMGKKVGINEKAARLYYQEYKLKHPNSTMTFEEFVEVKRAAIRASLIEAQIFITLSLIIMALGADWDDDDVPMWRDNFIFHKLYQVLNKARSEIAFTFNPLEYAKLISNPFPIAGLAMDGARWLTNTTDELFDITFGEKRAMFEFSNPDKTDNFYYTIGFIPGGYQFRRLFNIFEEDEKRTR